MRSSQPPDAFLTAIANGDGIALVPESAARYYARPGITYRPVHRPHHGFVAADHLDEGGMWPAYFALTELTAADEARIGALVKKAVC